MPHHSLSLQDLALGDSLAQVLLQAVAPTFCHCLDKFQAQDLDWLAKHAISNLHRKHKNMRTSAPKSARQCTSKDRLVLSVVLQVQEFQA